MQLSLFSLVAFLATTALAGTRSHPFDVSTRSGCFLSINKYNYTCAPEIKKLGNKIGSYGCACSTDNFIVSYVNCYYQTGAKADKTIVYNHMRNACKKFRTDLDNDTMDRMYRNHTNFTSTTELNFKMPINFPVQAPLKKVQLNIRSSAARYYNYFYGELFGGVLLGYFLAVFLIGTLFNVLKSCAPGFVKNCQQNKLVMLYRQNFANPALFGFKHSTPASIGFLKFQSIPTRGQTWILLGYLSLTIIFMFIKYDIFKENVSFTVKEATDTYIADRAGIMAVTQLPLVFLTAGRNNFLLTWTGWSYDTMNVYHRWSSRVMYALVFVHAIAYTDYYIMIEFISMWKRSWMIWGITSSVSGGFILFFSLRPFRSQIYEAFLALHIVFAVIFLVGAYKHMKPFGWLQWIWTPIGIWIVDRSVRFVRIVISGVFSKSDTVALPDDYIRMKIKYSNWWKVKAGSYVFLHYLKPVWAFWENHPFTCYPSPVPGEEDLLVVMVKARDGATKRVNNYLKKHNNHATLPVFVDGPYGQHFPIAKNDTMVFVSGGIGIAAAYSYACQVKSHSEKKRVVFYWITKSMEHVAMFKEEIQYLSTDSAMDIQIYLTAEANISSSLELKYNTSDDSKPVDHTSLNSLTNINYNCGKPNLEIVIEEVITESTGSVGVFVCGPEGLNDSVNKIVVKNMNKGNKQVNIYNESYNW